MINSISGFTQGPVPDRYNY